MFVGERECLMEVKMKWGEEKGEGLGKEGKNKEIVEVINVKILWKLNLVWWVGKRESICGRKEVKGM